MMNDLIIGELRMPLNEGMKLTLNEILIMQLGRAREREAQLHQTRLIMWEIRSKYLKKGQRIKPEDIFKIGNEFNKVITPISKEKFEHINNLWNVQRQKDKS